MVHPSRFGAVTPLPSVGGLQRPPRDRDRLRADAARRAAQSDFASAELWTGYGLFLLSLIVRKSSVMPGVYASTTDSPPYDIGFAIYVSIIYQAFYSDVTGAWRLKRWQRVVVDLGGTYLQFMVAAVFVAIYGATGYKPLLAAFVNDLVRLAVLG